MAIRDSINPDAAANLQAAAAEEAILGLLMLYPEHRKSVATGQVSVTAEHFVTAFHRRAFEQIMAMEAEDGGYEFSMMGEYFTVEEMGRLSRLTQRRRTLSDNGSAVLRSASETLAAARLHADARAAEPSDGIRMILDQKRKQINKQ